LRVRVRVRLLAMAARLEDEEEARGEPEDRVAVWRERPDGEHRRVLRTVRLRASNRSAHLDEEAAGVAREAAGARRVHDDPRRLDPAGAVVRRQADEDVVEAAVRLEHQRREAVPVVPREAGRAVAGDGPRVLEIRAPAVDRGEALQEPDLG